MRALVAAMPFAGHVQPMAAVAAELVGRRAAAQRADHPEAA